MSIPGLMIAELDLEAMVAHCRRELPNEACGILGGRNGRVESVHPVENSPPSPTRYCMDPQGQFRVLDALSRAGREVVGIYHSHPNGPAAPSRVDLEGALLAGTALPTYPGTVQVIVSLRDRAAPLVKGYAPDAGGGIEVPIVIRRQS